MSKICIVLLQSQHGLGRLPEFHHRSVFSNTTKREFLAGALPGPILMLPCTCTNLSPSSFCPTRQFMKFNQLVCPFHLLDNMNPHANTNRKNHQVDILFLAAAGQRGRLCPAREKPVMPNQWLLSQDDTMPISYVSGRESGRD